MTVKYVDRILVNTKAVVGREAVFRTLFSMCCKTA